MKNKILPNSTIHNKSAIDYIIFPCTYNISLPPFAVGRIAWDNWVIGETLRQSIPLIDLTNTLTVLHQNHPPRIQINIEEYHKNRENSGGLFHLGTIRNAKLKSTLNKSNIISIEKRIEGYIINFFLVKLLILIKRHYSLLKQKYNKKRAECQK